MPGRYAKIDHIEMEEFSLGIVQMVENAGRH
jgi:hypothetical protein